jgi:hypothetical protein
VQFAQRRVRLTSALSLELRYEFTVTSRRPRVVAYWYALFDESGRELVLYHWHPHVGVSWPHLHVGAAVSRVPGLVHLHLPTKRVDWPEVVRLLQQFTRTA